jgi:hypothetical protein
MTTIEITNSFHNTSIRLRPRNGWLSLGQIKEARRALCGVDGCMCSNDAGMRGHQETPIVITYNSFGATGAFVPSLMEPPLSARRKSRR